MGTSLREVLKQKAVRFAAEDENNKQVIEEWREAVERLFTQLEKWVDDADPEGFIKHERSQIEVTEPGLGRYSISRLNLRAFGKWVGLIPKARRTVKRAAPQQGRAPEQATGRVDITDEIRRFVLYRFGQGEEEQWLLDDIAAKGEPQPLTPDRFESALLGYFQ